MTTMTGMGKWQHRGGGGDKGVDVPRMMAHGIVHGEGMFFLLF